MSRVSLVEDIEERREAELSGRGKQDQAHTGLASYKRRATIGKDAPKSAVLVSALEYSFSVILPRKQGERYFDRRIDAAHFAERYAANLQCHFAVHVRDRRASKIVLTFPGLVKRKPMKRVRRRAKHAARTNK